jgi:hypothetical protein
MTVLDRINRSVIVVGRHHRHQRYYYRYYNGDDDDDDDDQWRKSKGKENEKMKKMKNEITAMN